MKKKSSYEYFSIVSFSVYNSSASYKFAKRKDIGSTKYRKGVVTVLAWIGEVTYHYLQKEKDLKSEFDEIIRNKEQYLKDTLKSSDYKEGVEKGFRIANKIMKEDRK